MTTTTRNDPTVLTFHKANDMIEFIMVQHDLGGSKPGSSHGPQAVMEQLDTQKITQKIKMVSVIQQNIHDTTPNTKHLSAILETMKQVRDNMIDGLINQRFMFVLSGDHSTSVGTIAGIKSAFPGLRLGIVWIDAHSDIHSPYTSYSHNLHGMPLGAATAQDNIEYQRQDIAPPEKNLWQQTKNLAVHTPMVDINDVVFVGLRDQEIEEKKLLEKNKCLSISSSKIDTQSSDETVAQIQNHLSACDVIYVSFDIDVLDQKDVPGTGTPADDGPRLEKISEINVKLSQWHKVVCFEMTEVNPLLDFESKTSKIAARIVQSFLHGLSVS